MPSTVVHVALGCLLACALVRRGFGPKAVLFVAALVAVPDLDTFLGLAFDGAHRAYLHNVWLPAVLGGVFLWDLRREGSRLRAVWDGAAPEVAGTGVFAVLVAGVLLDAFFNGVNLFWPLQDRFYDLSGELLLTDQRGVVQTFVDLSPDGGTVEGTTEDTHYSTGVEPTSDPDPEEDVERVFPVAATGERMLLALTGYAVVAYRLWDDRPGADA